MINYRSVGCFALSFTLTCSAVLGSTRTVIGAATSATTYSGAEGALGINNTSASGGALEGTVSNSGNTTFPYPYGVFGAYTASNSTFGIGIAGISTSGYAVGAEVLGTNPALFAESTGTGPALQLITTSSAPTALTIASKSSTGLAITTQNGGYGLEATASNGDALEATGNTAGEFNSIGGGNGSAYLGLQNGIGVEAYGADTSSAQLPAVLAQDSTSFSDVFDGYNSTATQVFQIESGTNNDSSSGIEPGDGSDVNLEGDLYVTGGLYECLQNNGGCSTIGTKGPKIPDMRTREGALVHTYRSKPSTSTIEDFGSGQVMNGYAYVRLDPAVAASLGGSSSYLVFITPGGDTNGLYFSNRTARGFEVRETGSGRSTLEFSYRIVAPRSPLAPASMRTAAVPKSPSMPQKTVVFNGIKNARAPKQGAQVETPSAAFTALLKAQTQRASMRTDTTGSSTAQSVPGSEGAIAYNNTATAGATLEGTVASSGNTTVSIPFGVYGAYTASSSTFGIGAVGLSDSGYGVGAEALGSNVAILGINEAGANGPGMQIVTTSVGQGMQVQSQGAGVSIVAGGTGYGIQVTSEGGQYAVYATSANSTAATFTSNYVKTGGQGSGGQAILGGTNGIGISALGYDNSSLHYPALFAESTQGGDIFDAYNNRSTSAIFQIRGQTADDSGIAPSNGTDVAIYGDFFVNGGIFQCSTSGDDCTAVTSSTDAQERQSEPTVEDFGEATLTGGAAYVRLDPKFADTIDRGSAYHVFLTPNGTGGTIYYSQRTAAGFAVRESQGGRSNFSFSYRIVAKPLGIAASRFPSVRTVAGPSPKPRIAGLKPGGQRLRRLTIHPHHLVALARLPAAFGGRR